GRGGGGGGGAGGGGGWPARGAGGGGTQRRRAPAGPADPQEPQSRGGSFPAHAADRVAPPATGTGPGRRLAGRGVPQFGGLPWAVPAWGGAAARPGPAARGGGPRGGRGACR